MNIILSLALIFVMTNMALMLALVVYNPDSASLFEKKYNLAPMAAVVLLIVASQSIPDQAAILSTLGIFVLLYVLKHTISLTVLLKSESGN